MKGFHARVLIAGIAAVTIASGCSNPERDKVRHVEKGDRYVADKRDDFAVIEYASAIRLDPKFGDARWKLAQAYERTGNIGQAYVEFVRAADALPDRREVQIKGAEVLILAGRFEDAKTLVTRILQKSPEDFEAHLLNASALTALLDTKGALSSVERAAKISPSSGRVFMTLGMVRAQMGQAADAESAFRKAVELEPSAGMRLVLANFLQRMNRRQETEVVLREIINADPRNLPANRMLADLLIGAQRFSEAEQPLKTVAEVSSRADAQFLLVDFYVRAGRAREATDMLASLATKAATRSEAERRLSSIDYQQGRPEQAHKRLDALLLREPKNSQAQSLKAQWLLREGELDAALASANAAVAAAPDSAPAHFTLGSVQNQRRDVVAAAKSFTEALRLDPSTPNAQAELARLNLILGDPRTALRFAEEARRVEPWSSAARVALARSLLATGNVERAQVEIAALLRGAGNQPVVHALQGALQRQRGDTAGARASYEQALSLSPDFPEALVALTSMDLAAKSPARAVARLEPAIARQPDNPTLLSLIAQAHLMSGDYARAEQTLRRAVAVDPTFTDGYAMLARLYMLQNKPAQALAEFEGMAKREPSNLGARTMAGVLFEAQGRRDEARKWYESIVSDSDRAPVAANNLAFIYAEQGVNLDIALQLATAAKPLLPNDASVDDTIGWVYYKKNLASLALGPLEESVKKRPNNAETLYHLGLTHAKLGNKARARDVLTKAVTLDPKIGGSDTTRLLSSLAQ